MPSANSPRQTKSSNGFKCEIGIDRARAVSAEQSKVHDFAGLAGFGDQRNLCSRFFPDQQIVYRGQRQQARDWSVIFIHAAIGKNQQRISRLHRQRSSLAQLIQRALQPLRLLSRETARAAWSRADRRSKPGAASPGRDSSQHRMRQLQHVAIFGRFFENVALAADIADQRHHHLFANGIDRRIRDLREELLEVIEQRLRPVGKARQRRIRAHRPNRLFALRRHRRENHPQIFIGISEGPLPAKQESQRREGACAKAQATDPS